MTPLWNKIFKSAGSSKQLRPNDLVDVIKKYIQNKSLPLGSKLPSLKEMSQFIKKPKKFMEIVWHILKNDHDMIEAHSGGGTYVTGTLPGIKRKPKAEGPAFDKQLDLRIFFDEETITRVDTAMSGLKLQHKKSSIKYETLRAVHRNTQVHPGLLTHFRSIVNNVTAGCYGDDELIYSQNYKSLLHTLCRMHLKPHQFVVMAQSVAVEVRHAMSLNRNSVRLIRSDKNGLNLTDLEELCKTGSVGAVLVNSRSAYQHHSQLDIEGINRLLVLKRSYKFILIEADRYLGFHSNQLNLLMEASYDQKADVVFLCPATMADPELHQISLLAGPAKLISPVKEHLLRTQILLQPELAFIWNDILDQRELRHDEQQYYEKMLRVNQTARTVLQADNFWKPAGIADPKSWVFYLEPLNGKLPPDTYRRLLLSGICTKDPSAYDLGTDENNGIEISLANYVFNQQLSHHLNQLTNCVKKQIL